MGRRVERISEQIHLAGATKEGFRLDRLDYLVDTNIFLELLLEQEKKEEVRQFLRTIPSDILCMSDFSLYSMGIILFKLEKANLFNAFVEDIVIDGVTVLSLTYDDILGLYNIAKQYNLDFDDSYQYEIVKKFGLQLISFDKDFDKTEKGKLTPSEVIGL